MKETSKTREEREIGPIEEMKLTVIDGNNKERQEMRDLNYENMLRLFLNTLLLKPIIPHRERPQKSVLRSTQCPIDAIEDGEDKKVRFAPWTVEHTTKPRRRRKLKKEVVMKAIEEQGKKRRWRRFSWLSKILSFFKRTRIEI